MAKLMKIAQIGFVTFAMMIWTVNAIAQRVNAYFAANGFDSNPCTQAAPCLTLYKASAMSYPPGSTINFRGGDNFTGCWALTPTNVPGGGDKNNPIVVQSYGTGRATWTSNCSAPSQGFMPLLDIAGVSGITVQNLILVQGAGFSANDGILIEGPGDTITIQNTDISGFVGPDNLTPGAQIEVVGLGSYKGSGCNALNHINILNNVLHGAMPTSRTSDGIYGFGCGLNINNINYSGNHIYNMGGISPASGNGALSPNGIAINAVQTGLVEHNLVHDIGANNATCGGPGGIMAFSADSITIRFNEVYNVRPTTDPGVGCDWVAYDLDGGTSNSVVEYNYGHDNAGTCLLQFPAPGPNIFRYNVCENNDTMSKSGGQMALNPSQVQAYNNTFYAPSANVGPGNPPACIFLGYNGSYPAGSLIENNICDYFRANQYGVSGGVMTGNANGTNITIKNNLYSSNVNQFSYVSPGPTYNSLSAAQAAGEDSGSVQGDPLLTSAGNGGTCGTSTLTTGPQPCPSAYQLQANSPAANAGISVSNNGGRDYYGNAVPATGAVNIGAFQ